MFFRRFALTSPTCRQYQRHVGEVRANPLKKHIANLFAKNIYRNNDSR